MRDIDNMIARGFHEIEERYALHHSKVRLDYEPVQCSDCEFCKETIIKEKRFFKTISERKTYYCEWQRRPLTVKNGEIQVLDKCNIGVLKQAIMNVKERVKEEASCENCHARKCKGKFQYPCKQLLKNIGSPINNDSFCRACQSKAACGHLFTIDCGLKK